MTKDIALAVLTPTVTAVLGILGVVVGDWHQRRTQAGRRKLAFEDASKQVAFATEWWKARKVLADSPEAEHQATTRAVAWLEEASARVVDSNPPTADDEPGITLRRLFLAYPMQRRAARVLRGAFYFFLSLVPFEVGVAISFALNPERLGLTTYLFGEYFYWELGAISVLMVVAMVLRFCAVRVERSGPSGEKRSRVTLRRALLLYQFHRPAAKIVRIIFYIWVALSTWFAVEIVRSVFDDPTWAPRNVGALVGFVAWAVALRYWAASLEARRTDHPGTKKKNGQKLVSTGLVNANAGVGDD